MGLASAVAPATVLAGTTTTDLGSSHGLHYWKATDTSTLAVGASNEVQADCAPGTAPVGGGIYITGLAPQARVWSVGPNSFLNQRAHAWSGGERNYSGNAKTESAFVECRKAGYGGLTYVTPSGVSAAAGQAKKVKAKCPGDSVVTGGGVRSGSFDSVSVTRPWDSKDADHAPSDGWLSVITNGAGSPHLVFGYAVCASTQTQHYGYVKGKSKVLSDGQTAHVTASCPAGTAIVSGGASITGAPDDVWLNTTSPEDTPVDADHVPDNRWGAYVVNDLPVTILETARAYAVCFS